MPDKVKCAVSNCRYWQNNDCRATAIEVNTDDGGRMANNSKLTQCHTFEAGK